MYLESLLGSSDLAPWSGWLLACVCAEPSYLLAPAETENTKKATLWGGGGLEVVGSRGKLVVRLTETLKWFSCPYFCPGINEHMRMVDVYSPKMIIFKLKNICTFMQSSVTSRFLTFQLMVTGDTS